MSMDQYGNMHAMMMSIRANQGVTGHETPSQETPSQAIEDADGNTTSEISNVYPKDTAPTNWDGIVSPK